MNARYMPAVYELGEAGSKILKGCGYDARTDYGEARQFHHELMACDIVSSIELGCREQGLRFIPWQEIYDYEKFPEPTRRSDNPLALPVSISYTFKGGSQHHTYKPLIPDAVFGIEYPNRSYRFFALEADRNHEPVYRSNLNQTSYLRKILQYQRIAKESVYKQRWGIPNLLILNVTINAVHQQNIMRLAGELSEGGTYLLFKTVPSLGSFERAPQPMPPLLSEPWECVGREPLRIDCA